MAEQVDSLAAIRIEDEETRQFLRTYLGGGVNTRSLEDARSLVLRIKKSPPNPRHVHPAANILFRYKLLDVIATVLEIPPHDDLQVVQPMPPPLYTVDRLNKV
jgi:hypothetical protein